MSKVLTIEDVSNKLQLSKSTIYKHAEKKVIPSFKIGASRRFFEDEINEYLITIAKEQRNAL